MEIINRKDKNLYNQLVRSIISFYDISSACYIGRTILENKYHDIPSQRELLIALNSAMIISYCRPFSGNDKKLINKIGDLSERFLFVYNSEEKQMHIDLIKRRNKFFAHSDSDRIDLKICYKLDQNGENPTILPIEAKYEYFSPYCISNTKIIVNMCEKLISELWKYRNETGELLKMYIPSYTNEKYINELNKFEQNNLDSKS